MSSPWNLTVSSKKPGVSSVRSFVTRLNESPVKRMLPPVKLISSLASMAVRAPTPFSSICNKRQYTIIRCRLAAVTPMLSVCGDV